MGVDAFDEQHEPASGEAQYFGPSPSGKPGAFLRRLMESADAIERHMREVLAAKQLSRALVRVRPSALLVAP